MCFDAVREGSSLWFSSVEESRVELPYTRHGVGGRSLRLEDLAPLLIRRGDSQGVSLLSIFSTSKWHEDVPGSSSPVLLEWDEETRRGLCSTISHMSAG